MKIIHSIPPKLGVLESKGVVCAIDIEVGNLPEGKLHHKGIGDFAILVITMDGENVYAITKQEDVEQALINVRHTTWAMHKGDFDITHLRDWAYIPARPERGQYWDTMYVERIQWAGYFSSFNLGSLSRRWLEQSMSKEIRGEFSNWNGILTDEQTEYAALDAVVTWKIAKKQMKHVLPITEKYWWEIENIAFWAYLDFLPIPFDKEGWIAFAEEDEKVVEEISKKYEPVNLNSSQQVKELLSKREIVVSSTKEEVLSAILEKLDDIETDKIEILEDILTYRKASKHVSSYGKSWSDPAVEINGNWYLIPSYDINKASTGRPQASNPAIMTMPVRENPRYRQYVRADEGYVLIVGDYSQQEPRITTHLSQDSKLKKVFMSDGDVYVNIARQKFGEDAEISKKERGRFKDTFLGIGYGQTPYGLAKKWYGKPSKSETEETKKFYMEFARTFTELFEYLNRQERKKVYVETVFGRRFWLNDFSYQANNHKRNAPSQGTAADMKKMAIGQMWLHWREPFPFPACIDMHDEFVLHVPEQYAERAKYLLEHYMITTANKMCSFVPFAVDAKIVQTWLEAK